MKTIISFTLFPLRASRRPESSLTDIPDPLYETIGNIYPEGRGKRSINVYLPANDERLKMIRNLLRENGYSEVSSKFRTKNIDKPVTVTAFVEYEKSDFGQHEWYHLHPWLIMADYTDRNPQGLISNIGDRDYSLSDEERAQLVAGKRVPKIPVEAESTVTAMPPYALIMGRKFADEALAQGFEIPLRPTTIPKFVEWNPDIIFPVFSSVCDFRDPEGHPLAATEPRLSGHLVDGFFASPVLKYDRSAVHQLTETSPCDVARTREFFGNAIGISEPLILVSRRLTEWIITRDENIRWNPVELI